MPLVLLNRCCGGRSSASYHSLAASALKLVILNRAPRVLFILSEWVCVYDKVRSILAAFKCGTRPDAAAAAVGEGGGRRQPYAAAAAAPGGDRRAWEEEQLLLSWRCCCCRRPGRWAAVTGTRAGCRPGPRHRPALTCSPSSTSCGGSGTRSWSAAPWGTERGRSLSAGVASGTGWSGTPSQARGSGSVCRTSAGALSRRFDWQHLEGKREKRHVNQLSFINLEHKLHLCTVYCNVISCKWEKRTRHK